jgi:sulfotransferase
MDSTESVCHNSAITDDTRMMRRMVQVTSKDHVLKVVSMTRFHFVAGLPKAGARRLSALLAQNPRFCVSSDSPAEKVFRSLSDRGNEQGFDLDKETRVALLRASIDAIHHARPMQSVVFDNNPDWLSKVDSLSEIFPLSRFVVMVRDPARIAAELADEAGSAQTPSSLMAKTGKIGAPIDLLQNVLKGPSANRLLLVDYDRLLSDPIQVFDAMYGFLGEAVFEHDFRSLPSPEQGQSLPSSVLTRRFATPEVSGSGKKQNPPLPIWRRSQSSAATMLLPETG